MAQFDWLSLADHVFNSSRLYNLGHDMERSRREVSVNVPKFLLKSGRRVSIVQVSRICVSVVWYAAVAKRGLSLYKTHRA